jgi:ATP-dependent DNA helicase DinG
MSDIAGEGILNRLTPEAARQMRIAIAEAEGREVFCAGTLDASGRVASLRVCARGHKAAVPALFEGLDIREVVLHNHPTGNLEPSNADLEVASIYSARGHGVYIVDNTVSRVYAVVEPFIPREKCRLDPKELAGYFRLSGPIARTLPGYEVRPQQTRMVNAVAHAFNEDGVAVIEAPTGVGKTMAYLLAAALWAVRNRERVVISTRTINLQEQIVLKDIPALQRCLKETFTACLVKGRGNYLCLRRLERALAEATLFEDETIHEQLDHIVEWAEDTKDGSLSDLPFVPVRDLWERVCSESDTCTTGQCPNQKRCFVGRARREIAKADLIVANHHILFSDIAIKSQAGDFAALSVLPPYHCIIFDEAHSIEDSATEYFGIKCTRLGALATLSRFYRMERGQERGLIPFIKLKLIKDCPQVLIADFEKLQERIDGKLLPALSVCREQMESVFDAIRTLATERCGQIGRDIKWRLTPAILEDPALRELHRTAVIPAVNQMRDTIGQAVELAKELREIPASQDRDEAPFAVEAAQLSAYAQRLENVSNVLSEIISEALAENTVRWIEIDAKNSAFVRLARCPLHVGKPLAEWVYENMRTVVMTSATLAVQHKFTYLFDRLGLDLIPDGRISAMVLDSPFDFKTQAMLCIPADLPLPDEKDFLDATVECIRRTLHISGGHAFVLFTAFYPLDYTYRKLEKELRAAGITPLRQGEATRTQLLDRFRADTASVLFATDSFWEGVDVAGDALQCVILPKLPFRVPTEPILEARAEAISADGRNAFIEYSVPQAVIKFRQGFGRLIRRKSDHGAILVLDRRVVTRYYGRIFLNSLPELRIIKAEQDEVFQTLSAFYAPTNDTGSPAPHPEKAKGT